MFHHLWWSKFPLFLGVNNPPDFWSNLCPPMPTLAISGPPGHFRSPDGLRCGHRLAIRPAALRHRRRRLRRPRQRAQRTAGGASGGQALGDGHGAHAPGGENPRAFQHPWCPPGSVERKHFSIGMCCTAVHSTKLKLFWM